MTICKFFDCLMSGLMLSIIFSQLLSEFDTVQLWRSMNRLFYFPQISKYPMNAKTRTLICRIFFSSSVYRIDHTWIHDWWIKITFRLNILDQCLYNVRRLIEGDYNGFRRLTEIKYISHLKLWNAPTVHMKNIRGFSCMMRKFKLPVITNIYSFELN